MTREVATIGPHDLLRASTLRYGERDRKTLFGPAEAADVMETHVSTVAPSEPAHDAGLRMVRHEIGMASEHAS